MSEIVLKVNGLDEANLILKGLGELPLKDGVEIWLRLRDQVMQQLPRPPSPEAAAPRRGRPPKANGNSAHEETSVP